MSRVLTYSENARLARELVSAASGLAGSDGSWSIELDSPRGAASAGPSLLVKSQSTLTGDYSLTAIAITEAMKKTGASVVLIGSTKLGRMLAGKLAVMNGMGVLSDVRQLAVQGDSVTGLRAVYAGKFSAKVEAAAACVALVPQGAYEPSSSPASESEVLGIQTAPSPVKRLETKSTQKSSLDLRGAKIIVSAGRGVKSKDDLELIRRLAGALGGSMGASRPLSSDLGWLGEEYHIGLTGTYVHPDLYLAVGISGQLQHVAGIKDSKVIAAINKDKLAPIFQVSDYGVVGDLYAVVPAMLKLLGAP